jgi:SAM-dependent methyltransferase
VPDRRSRLRRAAAAAPWRLKLAGKLVLSRLQIGYGFWSRLTLFKHGTMDEPAYAEEVFLRHFERIAPPQGFVALELGPGDTVFSALIARALGASRVTLVDVGRFALEEVEPYRQMAAYLASRGLPAPDLSGARSLDDVLACCSAIYLTDGLDSLRGIEDSSVDFSFSHAVLEHVRAAELPELLRELHRLTAPGGGSSHVVDLEDHFAHALNNLRFSDRVWESKLFANSGFYTNRVRSSELVDLFQQAGFDVEVVADARWRALPTPRSKLAPRFRAASEDDLLVHNVELVARPRAEP